MSSADNFTVTRTPFHASLGLHDYLHNVSCQVTSASQLQTLKKLCMNGCMKDDRIVKV